MNKSPQNPRDFLHVRLWEVAFLLIVGALLAFSVSGPNRNTDVAAMTLSVVVLMLTVRQSHKTPRAPAYPSPQRWPYLCGWVSAMFMFWHAGTRIGLGESLFVAEIVVVLVGFVPWLLLERTSLRRQA